MNQSELVEKVAQATELNTRLAGQAVKAVVAAILGRQIAKIWRRPHALSKRRATSCVCVMAGGHGRRHLRLHFQNFASRRTPPGSGSPNMATRSSALALAG